MKRLIISIFSITIYLAYSLCWGISFSDTPLNAPIMSPPNLLFSISVEFPTAGTAAYKANSSDLQSNYDDYYAPGADVMVNAANAFQPSRVYDGYFDSNKCYNYIVTGSGNPLTDEYFAPSGSTPNPAGGYNCSNAWNGNFLNWLSTSALDIYRKYLTGGSRDVDSPTVTRLVRSWVDGRADELNFPDVWLDSNTVSKFTAITPNNKPYIIARGSPSRWGQGGLAWGHAGWYWGCRFYCSPEPYGDRMRIIDPSDTSTEASGFNWSTMPKNRFPRLSVLVCQSSYGNESNCQPYYKNGTTQYYKPTGLIQQNQSKARFGAFSYVNVDFATHHAGGVMRSPLKMIDGSETDSNSEIDPATGVFIYDPESLASGRSNSVTQPLGLKNSGLINYLNQFGSIPSVSGWRYVQGDVIGELLYESLRYFALPYTTYPSKMADATPEYIKDATTSASFNSMTTDGFPIFKSYKDPVLNSCQSHNVVFIGDANQNCDSRIPGGVISPAADANSECPAIALTKTVPNLNVKDWINKIELYEGAQNTLYGDLINGSILRCPEGDGSLRGCWDRITPNISGLSYWAHVSDIRTDLPGRQSVNIFMVDVHEQLPTGRMQNSNSTPFGKDPTPYWLAAKYGGFNFDGNNQNPNSDPFSWSSVTSGVPDNFLITDTPSSIKTGLERIFNTIYKSPIRQGNGKIGISTPTNIKDTTLYKTYYQNTGLNMWAGNIIKSSPSYTTDNKNNIIYTTDNPSDFDKNAAGWLKDNTVDGQPRQIITASRLSTGAAISGVPFQWNSLTSYAKNMLLDTEDTDTQGNQKLNYLRGDRSLEISASFINGFRTRPITVLGDIIDSSPVYVGKSQSGYSDSDFSFGAPSFKEFSISTTSRRPMLYVGANDGMLHGFDANTLKEVFAFIPNSILPKIKKLTQASYSHDYFVNETPIVAEIPSTNGWTSQLIGFPGIGGKGLFALDITSPDNQRPNTNLSNAENHANSIFLWELNGENDDDIGYIINKGQSNRNIGVSKQTGKMANNKYAMITGNGYNSKNNSTGLFIVYFDSTSNGIPTYKKIMIAGETGGLSAPTAVDIDFDGEIDYAYAGDLKGNIWRFNLQGDESTWSAFKLFSASDSTGNLTIPITTSPAITYHCTQKGLIIIAGTGKYIEKDDNTASYADGHQDYIYGIWDNFDNTTINFDNLGLQYYYASGDFINQNTNTLDTTKSLIITSDNAIDWNTKKGWYLPLYNNYPRPARIVTAPYIVNNLVYFNTITPDFPACGEGKLWGTTQALQTCTGARPNVGVFDTNNDGVVNDSDKYNLWGGGNMVNVTGVNVQDQQRIFDASVWIDPQALTCKDSSCTQIPSTALMGNLGIAQFNNSPRRATWQEIKQP